MKNKYLILFAAAFSVLLFYFILGIDGALSSLIMVLAFIPSAYLLLDFFDLEKDEKAVFSFFVGTGVLPSLSYWLGIIMPFKLAIILSFVILVAVGFFIKRQKKPNHNNN